jgi:hypothetical protein
LWKKAYAYARERKFAEVRSTDDTAQNNQGTSSRRLPIRVRLSTLPSHLCSERHPAGGPAITQAARSSNAAFIEDKGAEFETWGEFAMA